MRIAVCDDDLRDADVLVQIIKRYNKKYNPEVFSSAKSVLAAYTSGYLHDLIFMDIQMEGVDGFTAAHQLKKQYPGKRPLIVFATASHEQSVYGYEFAFRYIVKPLSEPYVFKTLKSAENKLASTKILIPQGLNNCVLETSRIMYAEINNVTLTIQTTDGKSITTRMPMDEFRSMLSTRSFFQTHRGFIVGLEHVVSNNGYEVQLADGTKILLSRSNRKEFGIALRSYLRGDNE